MTFATFFENMKKILIGKIVNVVGLKGEVKVYNYSDSIDIYENTEYIYVDDSLMKIQKARMQKNVVVLKLEGIEDRDTAERTRGCQLFITEEDLPKLPKGEYYVRDLIGMEVVIHDKKADPSYEQGSNELLGVVTDVIQNTAQSILEVETLEGKKVLIPHVPIFVLNINEKDRKITVSLIDGMLD